MSSLFHEVEVALADLGLAALDPGEWDVVVGGLGLGYTAVAALQNPAVRELLVVDALEAVIDWHQRGLVPLGPQLTGDPRCRFVHGDFFALAASPAGFDPASPGRRFHAILLDIDHSPRHLLHPRHGTFYSPAGLRALAAHLQPDGVFALWSDDPPDDDFLAHAPRRLHHRPRARRHLCQSPPRPRLRQHRLRRPQGGGGAAVARSGRRSSARLTPRAVPR